MEHKLTYDYIIGALSGRGLDKIDITTKNILRLGMCQILHMDSVPDYAAVNETVKLSSNKGQSSFVNAILRKLIRAKQSGEIPMPSRDKNTARYLSVYYSFPLWICKHFISLYGEDGAERLLKWFSEIHDTDITVNINKISADALLAKLSEQGVQASVSDYSSLSIRLSGSVNPVKLYGFAEGYFFVQDESCAISAEALGAKAGSRVVDVCSCPGGKSFAAAMLTEDKGEILSLDIHASKLPLVQSGAERLGLNSISVAERDAVCPIEEQLSSFDFVICDVPCSGLGVLGKKADMRYSHTADILTSLPELQYRILEQSARYLKDGGEMIYSTCTLNPKENEEVVKRFLSEHTEYCATDFTVGPLSSVGGMLTLLPHVHHTDGFFIAKLKKRND